MDQITMPDNVTDLRSIIKQQRLIREQIEAQRLLDQEKARIEAIAARERQKAERAAEAKKNEPRRVASVVSLPDTEKSNELSSVVLGDLVVEAADDGAFGSRSRQRVVVIDRSGHKYFSTDTALWLVLQELNKLATPDE